MTPSTRSRIHGRSPATVALIGTAVMAVGLIAATAPSAGAAAPPAPVVMAAPVSTSNDTLNLAANPGTDLRLGGVLTVAGSGYDTDQPLMVAVCAAEGQAPRQLTDCIGGAIPATNKSQAWGYVTKDGAASPSGGGVPAKWGPDGSFSLVLTLPATDRLNCAQVGCAVFTTTAEPGSAGDLALPVSFAQAAPPSGSTSVPPSSPSSQPPASAVTVQPKTLRAQTIAPGAEQQVLFAGFTPGEKAAVTLFSEPKQLPAATADELGLITITFTVPKDLPDGTHLLQVVGEQSRVTGIARFTVTAPPPSTSVPPTSSAVPTSSAAPASSTVRPTSAASAAPPTASVTASASSSAAPAVVPPVVTEESRPVWPWFGLGGIALIAVILVAVLLGRRRSRRLAEENVERERLLAEAAAARAARDAQLDDAANAEAPTTYIPNYPGPDRLGQDLASPLFTGEFGLLSGRHPDDPGLLSGRDYPLPDEPVTSYLPPEQDLSGEPEESEPTERLDLSQDTQADDESEGRHRD